MKPFQYRDKHSGEGPTVEPGSRLAAHTHQPHTHNISSSSSADKLVPDPQVSDKAFRRKFTADYKLKILQQADLCSEPGQIGALLRREGLYSSLLFTWRKQRQQGVLNGLSPHKRGRKQLERSPLVDEIERLRRENELLRDRLKQAETIIEVQKKVSLLFVPAQGHNSSQS